jgi:hypothetical protein
VLAWAVVIVTVVVVAVLVVVLARQGAPWGLSEQRGTTRSQQRSHVQGRPAGPEAEAMGADRPGEPTTGRTRGSTGGRATRPTSGRLSEPAEPGQPGQPGRPGQDDTSS